MFTPFVFVAATESTTIESLQFDLATIQAATNKFSDDNKLGGGGSGEVYKVLVFIICCFLFKVLKGYSSMYYEFISLKNSTRKNSNAFKIENLKIPQSKLLSSG